MLNNLILVVLLVCFFWALSYAYLCIKNEVKTNKKKEEKYELTQEEACKEVSDLIERGDISEAQNLGKKYLCHDSYNHNLRRILVDSYISSKKEYDAIANLQVLTQFFPDETDLFKKLASLYQDTHQNKKAIHFYSYVIGKCPDDVESMKKLADLHYKNKQKESALKLFKQLVSLTDDEGEKLYYYELMGSIYSSYGEYEKAINYYEKVLEKNDSNVYILKDLRRIYIKAKNTQKVIDYSEKLIRFEPENYQYYEDLVNLFMHLHDYDSALSYAERALHLPNADFANMKNSIAKIYIKTGKIQDGINLINETLLTDPTNVNLIQTLALAFCVNKDFEMAKKACQDSLEIALPSEIKHIRNNLSTICAEEAAFLLAQNKNKEAFDLFNEAMKYNNENPEIYYKLGCANLSTKNYPEAIKQCKRAIELSPESGQYYEKLADVYYEIQNYIEAKKAYKDTLSIDPKNARAHAFLGIIQAHDKEYETSIKSLETAVSLDPNNPDIIYNLGLAYECAGQKEKAVEQYEKVLSINPEHKEAANNLRLL